MLEYVELPEHQNKTSMREALKLQWQYAEDNLIARLAQYGKNAIHCTSHSGFSTLKNKFSDSPNLTELCDTKLSQVGWNLNQENYLY